uniref:AB hydrolase-1 domain-containing protein n=1 Tax=Populus trichocarpa TaxID=3694 RepID=A0A3N7HMR9_POPTR
MPEGFYCKRWQEPGRAEADFGRFDVKTVIKNIYILFSGTKPPTAREDQEIMDMVDPSTPLPPWFSEEDLAVYASLYEKSGFRYSLQVPYSHTHVEVNGLKLHVAEIGTGPKVVLFLHGFPQIWYTWRYQMIAVAKAGYRAIAYDFRGYGLSELPAEPEKGGFIDLVEDTISLLDTLGISKAFLIGTDLGSIPAYMVAVLYPERVSGVVSLGIPFMLPGPSCVRTDLMSEGFYCNRWKEPGRAEADFGRFDIKTVVRNIYVLFSGKEPPTAKENQEIMDLVDPSTPLPPWFSEEDLAVYASLYEKSGFRYPLQVPYRTIGIDCCGITNPKVLAPTLLIMGEKDYVLGFPGMVEYIKSDLLKHIVPDLDSVFLEEGNHFVHEKLPEQVNEIMINFLNKHRK